MVNITAGVTGLVAAIVLGKRVGYGSDNLSPYNLGFAVIGAALLWVGWFGFNAGSAVGSSGGRAGMAMLVTQIAAAGAVLAWVAAEWIGQGKPSVLGAISGSRGGLADITPAARCGQGQAGVHSARPVSPVWGTVMSHQATPAPLNFRRSFGVGKPNLRNRWNISTLPQILHSTPIGNGRCQAVCKATQGAHRFPGVTCK